MPNAGFRRRTFVVDSVRAVPAGVIETVSTTFSILLADRVFGAGIWSKASLVAIPSMGLLLTISIALSLTAILLLLPALMAWAYRVQS